MRNYWALTTEEDVINLNNICHAWVERGPGGYFIMGQMIHNNEEVVLSILFENRATCRRLLYDLFSISESLPIEHKDH